LSGTLNMPMRYDDLSALSPVVRKEVLTGELSRRLRSLDSVNATEVDSLVDALIGLSLSEVVTAMQDTAKLEDQIERVRRAMPARSPGLAPPVTTPSPSNSQDSRLLDPNALNATASAPEHPSTPISVSPALSTPPRTSSPAPSVAVSTASERERIYAAVTRLEPTHAADLTDLLMGLPKRERAMCLFNVEVLRVKIQDAKAVLEALEDDEEPAPVAPPAPAPVTPVKRATAAVTSPATPDLSSRGASAAASPTPATPGTAYTLAALARMPAGEILKLARKPNGPPLPFEKADPLVVKATDAWLAEIGSQTEPKCKQAVGNKACVAASDFCVPCAARADSHSRKALAAQGHGHQADGEDHRQAR
jgi:polyadenylate-binding protein